MLIFLCFCTHFRDKGTEKGILYLFITRVVRMYRKGPEGILTRIHILLFRYHKRAFMGQKQGAKSRKCTFLQKKCQKIWSYQKKTVPLHPLLKKRLSGAVVQLVRIPACHAVGREFESRPHRLSFGRKRPAQAGYLFKSNGPLAQLNRVPHYGCGGCRFESCMDHKTKMKIASESLFSSAIFVFGL